MHISIHTVENQSLARCKPWGTGKSSLIKLIRGSLEQRRGETKFIFVEFNAWLYQGYDDARASLVEVIAEALKAQAADNKTALDSATELLKRVNWLRMAKLTAGSAASLYASSATLRSCTAIIRATEIAALKARFPYSTGQNPATDTV